ncbi:hypothetical protein P3T25_003738 [Paraburkholderia sp. GAS32]
MESSFNSPLPGQRASIPAYVAAVRIERTGTSLAILSPPRLGDSSGESFSTEGEALLTGYSAARRIVDVSFRRGSPRMISPVCVRNDARR